MNQRTGRLAVEFGLNHLQALAGIPSYARPPASFEPAYLKARTLVSQGQNLVPEGADWNLPSAVWWWLTRQEERYGPWDQHGRWDPTDSLAHELRHQPVVDSWLPEFVSLAQARADEQGHPMVFMAPWPDGASLALSGSHDVDSATKWHWPTIFSYLLGRGQPGKVRRRQVLKEMRSTEPDPWWNFQKIRELEGQVGLDSTWFITPDPLHKQDPKFHLHEPAFEEQVQRLREDDQEIAVHGSYVDLERPSNFSPERRRLGEPTGMRHHYLRFRVENCWPEHARAGYLYDSSLGFSNGWGFRSGTAFPHWTWDHGDQRPLSLGELPLTLMDREYESLDEAFVTKLLKAVGHGHANLLWHVSVFDDRDFPGLGSLYHRFLLEGQQQGAWMATLEQVWSWWQKRNRITLVPYAQGLEITSPDGLEGLVVQGPLETPEGGHQKGNQIHLPPLQQNVPLRLTWS